MFPLTNSSSCHIYYHFYFMFFFNQDILCTPERRLQEDSKNAPISLSAGRLGHDRILLCNDALIHLQVRLLPHKAAHRSNAFPTLYH